MRKLLTILSAALCWAQPLSAAVKNPDTFVYASVGDIDSLDPAWSYDSASHNIISNVYEYLLGFKGSGVAEKDLIAVLAEKVPNLANGLVSKDGLSYRFPIRKGVKFHEGETLTAEDVRYSLMRFMLYDRDGGPSSLLLEPLLGLASTRKDGKLLPGLYDQAAETIRVEGDSVVFKLKKPFAPFLSILAGYGAIVSKSWCVAHGQWNGSAQSMEKFNNPKREDSYLSTRANGTGAFRLERLDLVAKEIVLIRHDGYWRKPARLKYVRYKTITEFATRKLMLQAGDADSIYGPQMYFQQLRNIPGVELIDGLHTLDVGPIIFFNFKVNTVANANAGSGKLDGNGIPPDFFSDLDARKAFAYSINYDAYVRDILHGKGKQAASFLPPGLLGYQPNAKKYTLDLKKAEEHFRKAWGGKVWEKGFKLCYVYQSGSTPSEAIGQMIKRSVESINPKFQIDIRTVQWSTFLEQNQQGKLPLFAGQWAADYPDSHNFAFPILHSKGYFPGKQSYSNPRMDALIEQAVTALDPKVREKLYAQIQDLIFEDIPNVPMADGWRYRAQRSWVKGFTFKPIFPEMPYSGYYYELWKE